MTYETTRDALNDRRQRITALRQEMRTLQSAVEPQPVEDYSFHTVDGDRRLSELFGDKDDLIVIHNMGASCPYCTLWADGFNGVYDHLADRAAFVLTSPDAPEAQRKFADSRGWRFPMASHQGSDFAADMGYRDENGGWLPGVSVFQRRDGRPMRVADTAFGPGDDFGGIWHLFNLFPEGPAGWNPKYRYG